MEREKRKKGQDLIDAGQLEFANLVEGLNHLEQTATVNGYDSSSTMLADQGSNGAGAQDTIIKPIRSVKRAVRTLNKNIKDKQGDVGFALHALMMKDD